MSSQSTSAESGSRSTATPPRQIKERKVLDLIAAHGAMSRPQVRDALGIAQPTAIDVFKRLEDAGHIQVVGETRQTRPGPRAILYGLVAGRSFVAGANVRDRRITAALGDIAGGPAVETISRRVDRRPLADQIADAIEVSRLQAGVPLDRMARTVIGVPGIVNPSSGDLGFSWDLPRLEGKLLAPLTAQVPTPVEMLNGVQLAALAEGQFEPLRNRRTFALLWIGAGVGACLMIDGSPIPGASGAAGQIGYTPLPGAPMLPVSPRAGGFDGDLQGLIGAAGLRTLATDLGLPAGAPGTLLRKAVQSINEQSQAYLTEVARRIAVACASIASVVDPGLFVLQGATAIAGGAELAQRVEKEFTKMSPLQASVCIGRISEDPELHGALELGRSKARDNRWGGRVRAD
ncbi:N-acetyl-D-glucosamine kinase [Microbacterium sp. Bi98]|uniref:ROK family transcriptional regulator n=1 Tax=Microbacterium sp. Bi98 TaxID=2821116 RepID=UPI001D88759F|nr:ROK family protein [Microbacterium sp. Bi98]CAH0145349.1 N-acetyl-D-glucosamine kinase [Microbacterium sp. Bi98]